MRQFLCSSIRSHFKCVYKYDTKNCQNQIKIIRNTSKRFLFQSFYLSQCLDTHLNSSFLLKMKIFSFIRCYPAQLQTGANHHRIWCDITHWKGGKNEKEKSWMGRKERKETGRKRNIIFVILNKNIIFFCCFLKATKNH